MRILFLAAPFVLTLPGLIQPVTFGDEGGSWLDTLRAKREAAREAEPSGERIPLPDFGQGRYTFTAWIKTEDDGPVFAKTAAEGEWVRGGKTLFIQNGRLAFDIGWVGQIRGTRRVDDGRWHHVAFVGGSPQRICLDGQLDVEGDMTPTPDVSGHVFKLGHAAADFPEGKGTRFRGQMDEVVLYGRVLSGEEIRAAAHGGTSPLDAAVRGFWRFDGDASDASPCANDASLCGPGRFADGRVGESILLDEGAYLIVACEDAVSPEVTLFRELQAIHRDPESLLEMAWEREDGIWGYDWATVAAPELARRYAKAARQPEPVFEQANEMAADVETWEDLAGVRAIYLRSRRYGQMLAELERFKLNSLREAIRILYRGTQQDQFLARLGDFESAAMNLDHPLRGASFQRWRDGVQALRRDVLLDANPLVDFDRLVFIKRYTYQSSHFYTDFIDGVGNFGGNLCILDLRSGEVSDLLPQMEHGIFGRFDLSFDARRIVFDWKSEAQEGFRLYEVGVDGTGLRQLTFRPDDEDERIAKYDNSSNGGTARMYFHQTDDMHPCYLPDGGVCFTSTRCEYGTLCDAPDHLSTAILHRINGDGGNMRALSNSAVSEFSPSMMADGNILYTRWEYVDKGQLGIKCLWAMRPDGTGSREIYGNDIQFPPTMLHGRQIPGFSNLFVMLGTPHYPQSGIGTVIRVDTTKNIRTREPMTYITPHVDIQQEGGWNHLVDGRWTRHTNGPLYMDPYPLSDRVFLVSYNPDKPWNDVRAYGLYLIDESGNHVPIYQDEEFSCWQPTPLRPRPAPPVLPSEKDLDLAARGLAECIVQDVHRGMEGIEPGQVKWLRILEQIPRPWACRRQWEDANHTGLISRGSSLAAKALHGIVPVHEDGSARFLVPAGRNVYFEALDENFMELQRERTYVNYMAGETRSCVGCHETPDATPKASGATPLAMLAPAVLPQPQPGDLVAARPLHYPTDVQPVLDRHCTGCHGETSPAAGLELTGTLTQYFSRSYENIWRRRLVKTFDEGSDWGGTAYSPPLTIGSHASRLVQQIQRGCPGEEQSLPLEDQLKITTWVDANAVYYGSYWGRRDIRYRDHPNFRPVPTFEQAVGTACPLPDDMR